MRARVFTVIAVLAGLSGLLAGCASDQEPRERGTRATPTAAETPPATAEPTTYEYEYDDAEPIDDVGPGLTVYGIGDTAELHSAELTINSIEKVESFPMECFDTYYPSANRSLHAVYITVKNTGGEVIYPDGQMIGDTWLTWRDPSGNQMSYAFPGCVLTGDETPSSGLMSGETASLPLLVEGSTADTELGWLELDDMARADLLAIVLHDDIELYVE